MNNPLAGKETQAASNLHSDATLEIHSTPGFHADETIPGSDQISPLTRLGRKFADRFDIRRSLGQGGFGAVYLVWDKHLQMELVLKTARMEGDHARSDRAAMFREEARKIIKLNHPGVVRGYETEVTEDGVVYILMEFLAGGCLRRRLADRKTMPPVEAAKLVAEAARILAYVHSQTVVHRDIKPENMMFDAEGNLHLTDFGLALTDSEFASGPQLCGTLKYASPQQLAGRADLVDGRTDIYSLGVVLYELLVGQLPYRTTNSGSTSQLIREVLEAQPRPPREINAAIPKELEAIVLKAMAKEPSNRYSTAADMADELEAFVRSQGALAAKVAAPPSRMMIVLQSLAVMAGVFLCGLVALKFSGYFDNAPANVNAANSSQPTGPFVPYAMIQLDRPMGGETTPAPRLVPADLPLKTGARIKSIDAKLSNPGFLYAFWIDSGSPEPLAKDSRLLLADSNDPNKTMQQASFPIDGLQVFGEAQLLVIGARTTPLSTTEEEAFLKSMEAHKTTLDGLVTDAAPWGEIISQPAEKVRGVIQHRPRPIVSPELEKTIHAAFPEFYALVLKSQP